MSGYRTLTGWRVCLSSGITDWLEYMETLSLGRNYFDGTTESLESAQKLQTLILSSNRLSCNVLEGNEAAGLGDGRFLEPSGYVLFQAGRILTNEHKAAKNPFEDIVPSTFQNLALVFAGHGTA